MTAAEVLPFVHQGQAQAFQDFSQRGFRNLIPITPAGCLLSERSRLALALRAGRDSRGKAPGIKGSDGRWRGVDWLRLDASSAALEHWGAMGAGVGLRLGNGVGAVDFDLTDQQLCEKTLLIFCELLPGLHCIRTGRAPKFLILVATADDLAYRRVDFSNGQRVEFLGAGRQCVLSGIHPVTGRPYFWHGGELPRFAELVPAAADVLTVFFDRLAALPEARSRVISDSTGTGNVPDQASLVGRLEDVTRAVEALPNASAAFPDRDAYLKVGYAIKAALPDHPDEAFVLYETWCGRWIDPPDGAGNDLDIAFADWSRMHAPYKVGAEWLYKIAEQYGKFERATVFFGPLPSEPNTALEAWSAPQDVFGDGSDRAPVELAPDILPSVLGRWAIDVAERMGVSLAFVGCAMIATASAAIGAKLRIQPRQRDSAWTQFAFLWFGLVEDPGGRKSPIISEATRPLRELNDRRARAGAQAVAEWKARQKHRKADSGSPSPKPTVIRYVVDTFTMEALGLVLSENPQGVLIAPDELSGLITQLDAYKVSKGGDRAALLRLFDGSGLQIDRVGTGLTHVEVWGAA